MEIVFDIVIVLILLFSIFLGYKKGLVNVGFNLFAIIISIAVTLIFYSPITNVVINNTQIDENIEKVIIDNGTKEVEQNTENSTVTSYIQNYAEGLAQNAQNTAVQTAAHSIAINAVGIGVMILLFIVTRLALSILKIATNIITKIPIIKQCNEIAGIAYGILRGLIIVYVILAITFFVSFLSGDSTINTIIENTYVTKLFYNNNIILKLLF